MEGMSLSFTVIFVHALRADLLTTAPPPEERRVAILRFGLGSVAYLVVLLLSLISPVATLVSAGGAGRLLRVPEDAGRTGGRARDLSRRGAGRGPRSADVGSADV